MASSGEGGRDLLLGRSRRDPIDGGDGNDMINVGADNDLLYGCNDNDTFVFTEGNRRDVIYDFDRRDNDQIDLSDYRFDSFADVAHDISGNRLVTRIDRGNDKLALVGTGPHRIGKDDFIL
ncbi:hypothetical protein [Cognatiyoonia koreensis]|nr:hypothetical protein [Cognatiyoonia koreensis]